METPKAERPPATAGLCADCQSGRVVISSRGSRFTLCQLSATDARFPRYPALPVLTCSGYQPAAQ